MDAPPKSNKQKRLEKKKKEAARAGIAVRADPREVAAQRVRAAESVMKQAHSLRDDPERLIRMAVRGEAVRVPETSDLRVIAALFKGLDAGGAARYPLRPNLAVLRRLVLFCWEHSDLLGGGEPMRFANGLLALSAHADRWIRPLEDWSPRSHNVHRQFHDLVRHLIARYDVPTFFDAAWVEGLTAASVVHQRWYILVAQGKNLRTAEDLPVPLTKKQANLFLQAPADFEVLAAFRYAQIVDLGGDERLVRSILATRIGTDFARDDFWLTVIRWLIAHPMLDPVQHGPIIDFLHAQRYVPSVPDPKAPPGEPRLVPPQPNLTMKGRSPETLLAAMHQWHRALGRSRVAKWLTWGPSPIPAFELEEGQGEGRRVFRIAELLDSRDLTEEGRRMSHCVGSYAASCHSGRVSIWSLRVTDVWGQEKRLLTLEVENRTRVIVQARQRYNGLPDPKELAILRRWGLSGGPSLSKWVDRS